MQQRYIFKVAYDGTAYSGWQVQNNSLAVANVLETTFFNTFGNTISLVGASRTDAGVHALGQVAHFTIPINIPPDALLYGWNNTLPPDIIIRKLIQTDSDFHARFDAQKKIYHYHFSLQRPLPFIGRYAYFFEYQLDLDKLEKILQLFTGMHDFKSFSGNSDEKTTIRSIDSIRLQYIKSLRLYRISVEGRSFLHHMIRRIVGASLHIGSYKHLKPSVITELLTAEEPQHMLPNAPAHGLVLHKVLYKEGII